MKIVVLGASLLCLLFFGTARATPPIETYGKLPGIEYVALSPSGERYALVAQDAGERKLFVLNADNKPLFQIPVGALKVRSVDWAGDDHVLLYTTNTYHLSMDFSFIEIGQILVANVKTQKGFWAMSGNGRGTGIWGDMSWTQENGRSYGYVRSITPEHTMAGAWLSKGDPDLYRIDLDTGAHSLVVVSPTEINRKWVVSRKGEILFHTDYLQRQGIWRVYQGSDKILEAQDPYGADFIEGEGRTPGSFVYWVGDAKSKSHFIEVQKPGVEQPLFPDRDVRQVLHDTATGLLIGVSFEDGERETTFFDPRLEAKMRGARKAFPGERVTFVSSSADLDRMVLYTESDKDSGTYWMVNIKAHSADVIGMPYPLVRGDDVGAVSVVDYKAADGLPIQGILTLPPGRAAHNLPVVVLPHGGPEDHDRVEFDWWAQAFASRGYAVFQPNFRGSNGYGVDFVAAGKGEWGRKMQTDISDGLAALAAKGIVDPKRACVMGGSYGGYAALAGVTLQHGLYRCAVSVAGISDLGRMIDYEQDRHGDVSDTVRYWRAFMSGKDNGSPGNALSPAKLADHADAPILLIHGKKDTVVEIEQSYEMLHALQWAGKPVEMVVLPDEDHWLSREATRVAMLKAADAFIEKYNPPN